MKVDSLPQYWDDEVKVFHPYFEKYLAEVITEMGLQNDLEIIHHWTTKGFSGIIDFAICNKASKKVFLAIEVKKTALDLKAIGRKQARGYLETLGTFRGSDYYLATNLEYIELFRDSPERKLTIAQLLNLPNTYVGNLRKDNFEQFTTRLKDSLKEVLSTVKANDGTNYASNISGLLHALETSLEDMGSWHQAQAFYSFDYIRGALSKNPDLNEIVNEWKSADSYAEDPMQMNALVSKIDFGLIYEKAISGRFNKSEISQITAGAHDSGLTSDCAEDLSAIVNEVAYKIKRIPGAVETSMSLANLLSAHAKSALTSDLKGRVVFDPGCGTGGLLAAIGRFLPQLTAQQIFGIEKEELFRSSLALRVGLHFQDSLSKNCQPNLSIKELETLTPSDCENVGLVVMNPPFIRGIDCFEERSRISKLITQLFGRDSTLTREQLGYECGYLELVTALVPEGTVIATVFPKNALLRQDSKSVRRFLLESFGLSQIIIYPDEDLFGSIQKSTLLLIGIKGEMKEQVSVFKYKTQLSKIDFAQLCQTKNIETELLNFAEMNLIDLDEFVNSLTDGWKSSISSENVSLKSIQELIFQETSGVALGDNFQLIRGSIGNQGGSDLLFNPKKSCADTASKLPSKWSGIPVDWICPAAKNSDGIARKISQVEGESGLLVPEELLSSEPLTNLVEAYLATQLANSENKYSNGAQRKKSKSAEELIGIIEISRPMNGPLVLIPRAQRTSAQISYTFEPRLLVSTNFFTFKCKTEVEALIMSSWFLSIFGQVQLEFLGIDQEGMRKVEKNQIGQCFIPAGIKFDVDEIEILQHELEQAKPLAFRKIEIRPLDIFWAEKIGPNTSNALLSSVQSLLQELCDQRLKRS